MRRSILTFAAALLLSSCTVGPDYQAPDLNAPSNFVSQDVLSLLNSDRQDAAVKTDWWTGFEDGTLNDLVAAGLEHNFEIAAAVARVKEAQARVGLADAGDALSIDAGADADVSERQELNGDTEQTTTRSMSGSLGFGLPLDIFGQTRRDVEAANAALESENAALKSVVLDVSTDIASEYLTLRGNQRQLELLRESVALQEKTMSIVNSRYKAGLAPELDLRRAETSVENLRASIPPLEEDLKNSRNRLATLTGKFPGEYEQMLSAQKASPVYKSAIPELIPMQVLKMRPDVRQAEADLKEAVANIGVAEADYYPALRLTGNISIGTTIVSSVSPTEVLVATIGGLIDQVLTDGGARAANLDIAKARAEAALATYEQTLRTASEEVERSLAAIESSLKRQTSLEKSVSSSQRSFAQAETLYQQGLISFLDVVDAQRVLASAEQNLASERTNYATQIAILFRVLAIGA